MVQTSETNVGRWVLLSTVLASSMAFVDSTALNVALPALQTDLQTTAVELLWILNGYLLMLASLILVGGSLGDHLGRKRVFMSGIILFMVASLACGLAPTAGLLIIARVVQGIGGALLIPGSLAIITATFDRSQRGRAIGTWSAATTIVFVIGPALGGVLAQAGLWRGVFLINLPLGIVSLLILYRYVPESRDEEVSSRIDIPGAVLATLSLAGLSYGFISAPDFGFGDARIIVSLGAGLLALIAFILVESRSDHPMMPLHLFRSRTFSGTNLLTLFLYGAGSMYSFFLSLNLVQVQGYSESEAGLAFVPFALVVSVLSPWAGGLVDRYGPRLPLIIGPTLVGIGFAVIGSIGQTNGWASYWTTFFPGVILYGLGMGITIAPLTTSVMSSVATHYSGTASGINNAVSRTAGVLTTAILGGLALFFFIDALSLRTDGIDLSQEARAELRIEAQKLAGAVAPEAVPPEHVSAVEQSIRLAFIDTFQVVLLICASMAILSAIMAALLVEKQLGDAG